MSSSWSREAAKTAASRKAVSAGSPWVVVSLCDGEDGRVFVPAPERYLDEDEFEAFDGQLIDVCYPDGRVE